jgi:DNA polymerase-3 subunit delta
MAKTTARAPAKRKPSGSYGPRPAQVLAAIEEGRFEPLYILFGPDSAAAEDIVVALKSRLLEPGFGELGFDNLHPPKSNEAGAADWVAGVLQLVNTPPMGVARRLVVVRDLNRLDKRQAERFCAGLAKSPDFTTVVLVADFDFKLKELFLKTGVSGRVVNAYDPRPDELIALLQRWSKERGFELTADGAALLRDIAGTETSLLRSEVEKVAAAVGKNGRADTDVVREVASNSREYSLNEYVERAVGRDLRGALSVLRRLFEWGESPVRVEAWLALRLLRLVGHTERNDDTRWLNRALYRLYDINRETLTGHPEPELLIEQFTICLACSGERSCRLYAEPDPPGFCLRRPKPARRRAARTRTGN